GDDHRRRGSACSGVRRTAGRPRTDSVASGGILRLAVQPLQPVLRSHASRGHDQHGPDPAVRVLGCHVPGRDGGTRFVRARGPTAVLQTGPRALVATGKHECRGSSPVVQPGRPRSARPGATQAAGTYRGSAGNRSGSPPRPLPGRLGLCSGLLRPPGPDSGRPVPRQASWQGAHLLQDDPQHGRNTHMSRQAVSPSVPVRAVRLMFATVATTAAVLALLVVPARAAGVLVSDDLSVSSLGSGWSVSDPVGDGSVELVGQGTGDAYLSMTVGAGESHDAWGVNRSLRVVQEVSDSDFAVDVGFDSVPSATNEDQGLLVEQDE